VEKGRRSKEGAGNVERKEKQGDGE